jgi:hypothetical protein
MTSPTGNRWVNQDTKDVANPDNIQTDLPGNPGKVKYGPAVTGEGEPPQPTEVGVPVAGVPDVMARDEGMIEPSKLGPLDQGKTEQNAEIEQAKLDIRNYRRVLADPKGTKAAKAAAEAQLGQIAAKEYARADGGRDPVKRALARAGFANPTKE